MTAGYKSYDTDAARAYATARFPVGLEILLGALASTARPLAEMTVLDAGCGIGLYTFPIARRVKHVIGVDLSEAMLAHARDSAARDPSSSVTFLSGSLFELPLPDASVDAVIVNQVLHHLEAANASDFSGHRRALAEARRVVKSGGIVIVGACSHLQLLKGFWYYALIPSARDESLARCAPASAISTILADVGLHERCRIVPVTEVLLGESYFNPEGPLCAEWRQADSIWALVKPPMLDQVLGRCRDLQRNDRMRAFMLEHDAERADVGQCTFFLAHAELDRSKPHSGFRS